MQQNISVQVGKWGSSLGIRLPEHVSETLGLIEEDTMFCNVEDGKLILAPFRRKKYTLQKLLSEVKETSQEIPWGKPAGKEIW